MKLGSEAEEELMKAAAERELFLEGGVLKILESSTEEFKRYLDSALVRDRESRRKRLEVTKQIQRQNVELLETQKQNEELMSSLQVALAKAEDAKTTAEQSLDFMQKRTQFELMTIIVRVTLGAIIGVGAITSVLYVITILSGSKESEPIGHAWSSIFGILLTNSFSILGTVMGIKYAQSDEGSRT